MFFVVVVVLFCFVLFYAILFDLIWFDLFIYINTKKQMKNKSKQQLTKE